MPVRPWHLTFLAALCGCSYTSTYRPLNDGRARVVWAGNSVRDLVPPVSEACAARLDMGVDIPSIRGYWRPGPDDDEREAAYRDEAEADEEARAGEPAYADETGDHASIDISIEGDSSGAAGAPRPRHHRRAAWRGSRGGGAHASRGGGSLGGGGRGYTASRPSGGGKSASPGHSGGGGKGGGGHGGGGGGGGKGAGAAVVAALVIAYLIIPTTSILWAETPTGSDEDAAQIDRVNAYNDLVRAGDDACGGAP